MVNRYTKCNEARLYTKVRYQLQPSHIIFVKTECISHLTALPLNIWLFILSPDCRAVPIVYIWIYMGILRIVAISPNRLNEVNIPVDVGGSNFHSSTFCSSFLRLPLHFGIFLLGYVRIGVAANAKDTYGITTNNADSHWLKAIQAMARSNWQALSIFIKVRLGRLFLCVPFTGSCCVATRQSLCRRTCREEKLGEKQKVKRVISYQK